jgi:hypothetical protein
MFGTIKDLFGVGKDAHSVVAALRSEKKNTKGVVNAILAETEFNMSLILEHYANGVKEEQIIRQLRVVQLARALEGGFDFRRIRKGTVKASMIGHAGFFRSYVGRNCEHLMKSIRFHIDQIKLLPELYDLHDTSKVNARARLENLGKRYLLLTRFLQAR